MLAAKNKGILKWRLFSEGIDYSYIYNDFRDRQVSNFPDSSSFSRDPIMQYFEDSYYPQYTSPFNRRNSELAFEYKLRNSDGTGEGVEEMLAEAYASMDENVTIWPDTLESHPSPITSSSSSAGSTPCIDSCIPFPELEEGGNEYSYHDDSDCESDVDLFDQRPQLHGFTQDGRVYERSSL